MNKTHHCGGLSSIGDDLDREPVFLRLTNICHFIFICGKFINLTVVIVIFVLLIDENSLLT